MFWQIEEGVTSKLYIIPGGMQTSRKQVKRDQRNANLIRSLTITTRVGLLVESTICFVQNLFYSENLGGLKERFPTLL